MILTIRNKQNTRNIRFNKVWEGGDAASDVTIYLVKNGTVDRTTKQVIKPEQARRVFSFSKLPVCDDQGKTINYSVTEDPVPLGYYCYVTGSMENGFSVLNSKEKKETINVNVTKIWDDNSDTGKRPAEYTIRLRKKETGETVASHVLSSDELTYTFTDIPKYESGGSTPIRYTVTEDSVPGYKTNITGSQDNGFTVTNTYDASTNKMTVTVRKEWNQVDQSVGRPSSVTFSLKQNGAVLYSGQLLSDGNNWQETYPEMAIYDDSGNPYIYTVEEESIPFGYTVEYATKTVIDGELLTIRNEQSTREIRFKKLWVNGATPTKVTIKVMKNGVQIYSQDVEPAEAGQEFSIENLAVYDENGDLINYTVEEKPVPKGYVCHVSGSMANGFTVTNSIQNDTIIIKATKKWDDDNDTAGKRPDQITIHLKNKKTGKTVATKTLPVGDKWSYTFTDIPKYEDNRSGVHIPAQYVVTEDPVEGYTTSITGNQDVGFTITNTFSEKMRIIVGKEWVMADKEATHPDSVTFSLLRNDTELYTGQKLSKEDNWQKVYDDMPVYDGSGQKYTYSVVETVPDGYIVEYNTRTISGGVVLTIRNKQSKRDIQFKKVWEDGTAIDDVTIYLKQNGTRVTEKKQVIPKDKAGTLYAFTDLPVYDDTGRMILYTVEEYPVPDHYHCYITGSMDEGFTVLNSTEDKETITIDVNKVWDDNNDESQLRPDEIMIRLKKKETGETVAVKILPIEGAAPDAKWNWTFTDVPKEESGTPIIYTVTEDPISYYHTVISGNQNTGFTITNQLKTIYEDITVTKTWVKRVDHPNTLSVTLYSDADYPGAFIPVATTTLGKPDWQYVFENMPATSGDRNISYRVMEVVPAGYEYPMIVHSGNTFKIYNWITDLITMDIQKEWVGDNAKNRPDSLTVRVNVASGTIKTLELTAENGWKAHIDQLPILRTGEMLTAIPYKVEEDTPEGYSGTVTGGVDETGLHYNYTITNELEPAPTHEPTPYTYRFAFTKVWSNDREDSIDWTLYNGNGQVVHKRFNKKAISDMEWVYEAWFASDVSEYYIVENVPAGYRVTYDNKGIHADVDTRCYNGGTIINYKIPKTGDTTPSNLPWILCLIAGLVGAACVIFAFRKRSGGR